MKVFLDNCIFSIADLLESATITQMINWGGNPQAMTLTGYAVKPFPPESEVWKRENYLIMPTIAELCKSGKISLYKYIEVDFEGMKRRVHGNIGYVFNSIPIDGVSPAVERSIFANTLDFYEYINTSSIINFCESLLSIEINSEFTNIMSKLNLTEDQIVNLNNIERFKEICSNLSKKQYPDALHYWTAEVNNMDVFLTIDKKFLNAINNTKKLKSNCRVLSPAQLIGYMNEECIEFPYVEGEFIDFFGNKLKESPFIPNELK